MKRTKAITSVVQKKGLIVSIGLALALSVGCTSNSAPATDNSPVTIKIYFENGQTDQVYQTMFVDPIKKKYPNIQLEAIKNSKGQNLNDLVTAGQSPDLIYISNIQMLSYMNLGTFEDISPWVKKTNIDLSRFRPETLDSLKVSAPNGELYGLPFAQNYEVLYYNKDIFDKFGVSYPKDGMTWDDAIQLASKVTQMSDGVQYIGLGFSSVGYLAYPLASPYADDKAKKALIDNDIWRAAFDLGHRILDIPGNDKANTGWSTFLTNKNVAMYPDWTQGPLQTLGADSNTVNWDVVQMPSYKNLPNVNGTVDAHCLLLSKGSQHKDQAMEVMNTLTSEEVQQIGVKTGMVSPLNNVELQKQFGSDLPSAKGKNLQGIFKSHQIKAPVKSIYYNDIQNIINKYWNQYKANQTDLNMALQGAQVEADNFITAQNK